MLFASLWKELLGGLNHSLIFYIYMRNLLCLMRYSTFFRRSLVRRIIAKSVAPSTLQQYQRRWNQWTEHCHTQGVPLYRPSLPHLLGYLATISETSSVNVVYHHLSAINYFHRVELLPAVTDDELVGIFMKGLKRMELERNLLLLPGLNP